MHFKLRIKKKLSHGLNLKLKRSLNLERREKEKELEGKEELISSLEKELSEERQAKEIIVGELNQYKEMKFGQRLKFLFKK